MQCKECLAFYDESQEEHRCVKERLCARCSTPFRYPKQEVIHCLACAMLLRGDKPLVALLLKTAGSQSHYSTRKYLATK